MKSLIFRHYRGGNVPEYGMSALETVENYLDDVRVLLQDTIAPYRYEDDTLLVAFNVTLLEARRLRADLFDCSGNHVPSYKFVDSTPVPMEQSFRLALVYGTTAHALARDQEDVQDARASTFLQTFTYMLTGIQAPAPRGGTPRANQKAE